jgi:hypothetical protein
VVCGPALAFNTGNKLFSHCLQPSGQFGSVYCLGYITGVADSLQTAATICVPKEVTESQARDIALRYLQIHPEIRHLDADNLVEAAPVEVWPCRR